MIKSILNPKIYILLIHVGIGILLMNPTLSKSLNIMLLFVGFMSILYNNNKNNEAMLWSAYVVGSEVLFRMSKGLIFYETSKYMVFLFLMTGLIVEKRRHHVSQVYILYLILLFIGIAFSDIPFPESIRTNIIFNLSGPILLGLAAMYFYRRPIEQKDVLKMIYFMAIPMVAMLTYLVLKTPDLRQIVFTANSNYFTAGGFGPNQVSTILSLGAFCIGVLLYYKKTISGYYLVDVAILLYLVYRALLTLSRGGFITAVVAFFAFTFYYLLSHRNAAKLFVQYFLLVLIASVSLWIYTARQTEGMLVNRYTNKSTQGEIKEDFTTGRLVLMEHEFKSFLENPFFGIGVGSGKFKKLEELNIKSATHNEMSRLLGEHGAVGLIILFLLLAVPIVRMYSQPLRNRAFISAFLTVWFLTINHSAMRLAMPAFLYGLSVIFITPDIKTAVMVEEKEDSQNRIE